MPCGTVSWCASPPRASSARASGSAGLFSSSITSSVVASGPGGRRFTVSAYLVPRDAYAEFAGLRRYRPLAVVAPLASSHPRVSRLFGGPDSYDALMTARGGRHGGRGRHTLRRAAAAARDCRCGLASRWYRPAGFLASLCHGSDRFWPASRFDDRQPVGKVTDRHCWRRGSCWCALATHPIESLPTLLLAAGALVLLLVFSSFVGSRFRWSLLLAAGVVALFPSTVTVLR